MTKTNSRRPSSKPERQQLEKQVERKADSSAVNRQDGNRQREQEQPITSLGVITAHLTWAFLGPMALLILLIGIVEAGTGWATVLDVVYLAVLAVVVIARWIDQQSGQSTTSTGEASTWQDFRRWAVVFPLVAAAAWIAANVIGNYVL